MCEKISFTLIILISLWIHQEIHPLNAGILIGNCLGDSGLHRGPAQSPEVASKSNARHKEDFKQDKRFVWTSCSIQLERAGKARYKIPDNLAAGLFISMTLGISPCQEQLRTLKNIKCSSCCKSSLGSSKPCCKPRA